MNNKLQNIDLPEGLQSIKDGSFSGNFLTEIKIPESVTEIETGVFFMVIKFKLWIYLRI